MNDPPMFLSLRDLSILDSECCVRGRLNFGFPLGNKRVAIVCCGHDIWQV